MKKTLLITALFLVSCKKEEPQINCNCGLVIGKSEQDLGLVIQNECSKTIKKFSVTEIDFHTTEIYTNKCIYNVDNW